MKTPRVGRVVLNAPLAVVAHLLSRGVGGNALCLGAMAAVCFLGSVATLRAEITVPVGTEVGSGVTIKLASPVSSVPRFGFVPVRVSVENGTTSDGTWRLRFESGNARIFPGLASTTFELDVPASRTREAWFYVPLAEPGISINPAALTAGATPISPTLPVAPPPIAGVYPDPKIPGVSHDMRSTVSGGTQGYTRTFTITQIGPSSALPEIPPDRLPPNVTSTITRRASDGLVTRVTTVPVSAGAPGRPSFAFSPANPSIRSASPASTTMLATTKARNALEKAGLVPQGVRTSTSSRLETPRGGQQQVIVILRQSGPAAALPIVAPNSLPSGFTSVNVMPDAPDGSTVIREFTYVEAVTLPTMTAGALANAAPFSAPAVSITRTAPKTPSDLLAEARKALAPTGLVDPPPSVRQSTATQFVSIASSGMPAPSTLVGHSLVLFEQTGPAADLPAPPNAVALPPGVRVTVLPSGNQATRIVSYIDPAVLAALVAHVNSGGTSASISAATNLARLELQRAGFLRTSQPGVTVAAPVTRSSSPGRTATNDLIILAESGPAAQLPEPPRNALPAGITCSVTPGPIPGEMTRNFLVNVPAFLASTAPSATVPLPSRASAAMARVTSGTMLIPGSLSVEVVGPGLPRGGARVNFPNNVSNTAMPPLATTPTLEAVLRGKFSAAGPRVVPNLAGVEPAQLPADWRVWASFNAVLLKTEDFAALDPARRAALRSWVATGGILFLTPENTGEEKTERLGAGRVETLPEPIADAAPLEALGKLQLTTTAPGMPERERMTLTAGTRMGDLVTFLPPDTLWISLLLVLFALLVGPANVFFFAPAKKRHRLFFTTPLFSLVGAVAIALAILLQDGLGGEGLRRTLVVFVPGESQAAVFQEQAARTGFLARREFALDDGTLCAVLPVDGNVFTPLASGALFARENASAAGDWFRNRNRQAHLLRTLAPTRARVEIVGAAADGAPQVESTLTTELRDFRLRDEQGRIWSAPSVPTGRRTALRAASRFAAAATASLEASGNGTPNLNALLKEASTLTDPWQWVARGDAIDIAPIATLASVRWEDEPVLYAGVATRTSAVAPRANEKGTGQ